MISQKSKNLLQHFFDIELLSFIQDNETIGGLQKKIRIEECRMNILNFIRGYPNSVFTIKNTEKDGISTMSIDIPNIEEDNDHISRFTIIVAISCETFKVEKQLGYLLKSKSSIELIVDFEKNKI